MLNVSSKKIDYSLDEQYDLEEDTEEVSLRDEDDSYDDYDPVD